MFTNEEIQKDVKLAQKEFFEVCTTCALYLNQNGCRMDGVSEILHKSVDECIENAIYFRDAERTKNK